MWQHLTVSFKVEKCCPDFFNHNIKNTNSELTFSVKKVKDDKISYGRNRLTAC